VSPPRLVRRGGLWAKLRDLPGAFGFGVSRGLNNAGGFIGYPH
jgi:hypothetical protein